MRYFLTLWVLLSCVVGLGSCMMTLNKLTKLAPVSTANAPDGFFAVGFDKERKPVLLRAYSRGRNGPCIERTGKPRVMLPDEFEAVELQNGQIPGGPFALLTHPPSSAQIDLGSGVSAKADLLTTDPNARLQKYSLEFDNDDSTYQCVYSTDGRGVIPIKFGETTKAQGVQALCSSLPVFLVFLVLGPILNWLIKRKKMFTNRPTAQRF